MLAVLYIAYDRRDHDRFITARPKTPEFCSGDEARKTLCEKYPAALLRGYFIILSFRSIGKPIRRWHSAR
jgi:hypothetical protein